jgi:hypothetical protein
MIRNALAITLCALIVLPAQGAQETAPTVQELAGQFPIGSIVEVRTKLKNTKKVRGRLESVTKDGLEIQTAKGQTIENVKFSFSDVKGIALKPQVKGTHPAIWVLAVLGIAVGAVLLIALAAGVSGA